MKLAYLAFSANGYELAQKLAASLGGEACRSGMPDSNGRICELGSWTKERFASCDGIVFVGAMGIAVRAIAPYVSDKTSDPAVIVIDDKALHVIPILSGHLGGANDLARKIADITGSDCVITTATDINGVFAVDEWAKHQNCALLEPKKIVAISGGLLHGATVSVYSPWQIEGQMPEGLRVTDVPEDADVIVDIKRHDGDALHLVPRICVLGIGCRKGTPAGRIEESFTEFITKADIHAEAIFAAASIDIKKDEPGLIEFCENHRWTLQTFTSGELNSIEGDFTPSEFVSSVTGVDNVCERSAAALSGGRIITGKTAGNGVTLALAASEYRPDWESNI